MAAKRTRRGQINTDNNIKEMNRVRSGIYDRRPNAGHGFSRNFLQVMSWSGGKADGRSYQSEQSTQIVTSPQFNSS